MGTACLTVAGTHQPVLVYRLIFSASSSFSASGHFRKRKLICLSGLINLIWWLINRQGGSFGGTPPTRSVILSIHRSLSSGSDPRVFRPLGFTAAAELMSDLPPCVPRCLAACEAASWLHSGGFGHGFGGLLVTIHCTSSDDSDGMFIGTMYIPMRIAPWPVKSRVIPSHRRNGVPRITS